LTFEKIRPMIGMSPMNGIVFFVFALSVGKRPARRFVSPSFRRMFDEIVRGADDRLRLARRSR
jgi:hypothetical protein